MTDWRESFLGTLGRAGLVLGVLLAILLLSAVPLRLGGFGELRPAFALMAVYYWAILRPAPPLVIFVFGIVLDVISNYPLGMTPLALLGAQVLTKGQRKFLHGQPFPVIWAGFAVVALGATLAQWGLFSLMARGFVPLRAPMAGAALSALLFPLAVLPLAAVHRALEGRGDEGGSL